MKSHRWTILIASMIINMCIGSAYAWSVFQNPLISMFGWSTSDTSLAFTLSLSLVPVAMIGAGRIQDRFGPQIVTMAGGIVFGLGLVLTSQITSLTGLYLSYGLLGGFGIGMIYTCMVGNTIKWFPDKKGLAGGLIAMGFGLGAIVFAPVGVMLIREFDVLVTFAIFGVVFSLIIIVASFFIKAPKNVNLSQSTVVDQSMTSHQMMKTPRFYLLWILYTIGCIGGLMIIGHASPIVQHKVGLSSQEAAFIVSFLGLSNSLGRVFWGSVSDRFGRMVTLTTTYLVAAVCLLALSMFTSLPIVVVAIGGIALCFGGYLGIMPSICAENFGSKHIGINYGLLFTAYGFAAFVGPRLASWIRDVNAGSYDVAFGVVMMMNVVGLLLAGGMMLSAQKKSRSLQTEIAA
ncbi:MAG: OFA family MFS transporter [Erysipelothrix sp.]|nr:OFA family MFS transporter [Erysipelothrix sp.]